MRNAIYSLSFQRLFAIALLGALAACGEPRAVMLPLQYPDGSPVQTTGGEQVMAGYQTYGSTLHANATALYDTAVPASCMTCTHIGAVVSEPSVLRQATGVLGATTVGAGAVMGGVGAMNYGNAAQEGKLGYNYNNQYTNNRQNYQQPDNRGSQSWSGHGSAEQQNNTHSYTGQPDHHDYAGQADNHPYAGQQQNNDRGYAGQQQDSHGYDNRGYGGQQWNNGYSGQYNSGQYNAGQYNNRTSYADNNYGRSGGYFGGGY